MTTFVILLLIAAVLAALEYYWANYGLDAIRFKGEADHTLAEPGEEITWSATVENHSRLPIPFVRLQETFPIEAMHHASDSWVRLHCTHLVTYYVVEHKLSLKRRTSAEHKLRISFPRRGQYFFGGHTLSCGDLLGFRESSKDGEAQSVVIIPKRSKQQVALDALGGFLGDISVRRFILEDPILTMGFRDYTGREPMKSISWTRSATAGSLQVKQFDHTAEQHVMILLNVEDATPEELEECFRLTRTACEKLEQKKIPYGFRTNGCLAGPMGAIAYMAEGLGQRHLHTILYGLGRATDTCFYSFRYLIEHTIRHRSSNESYIIITPPLESGDRANVRKLENVVGNSLCILTAQVENEEASA